MAGYTGPIRGIKYVSLYEAGGYGNAARAYLRGLIATGVPLTWTPMVGGGGWGLGYEPFPGRRIGDRELDPYCNRIIDYDLVILHLVPEYLPLWRGRERDKRIVCYTVWETDKLPKHWPMLLNQVDQILVPCRWNKEVFERCGVEPPIEVIPHILTPGTPAEGDLPRDIDPADFVFYTIGTWTVRKTIWNTIRCYLDTFTSHDPALLVVKTSRRDFTRRHFFKYHPDSKRSLKKIMGGYRDPARVLFIDEEIGDDDIRRIHRRGDCYVSLCRAEGWGLGAFDAAGSGKPVIMTGFGGQLDYLPADLAYLVDYKLVPVVYRIERRSYSRDQNWAEPDLSSGGRLMRHVFENREEARMKGRMLGKQIKEHFDSRTITHKLMKALEGF